ncbi:hypothetical protein TruAng_000670 [Truncatella angustata]|nr:hypothetical protein TruAng_000670 [Truncatella angustata]
MVQVLYEEGFGQKFSLMGIPAAPENNEVRKYEANIAHHLCYPDELSAWQRVDSELRNLESVHHRYWWARHTGKFLAVLLHNAKYPRDTQYRDLKFFAQVVAPNLGVSRESLRAETLWPSFMTDDGTPIELSWDWGTNDSPPTIRYSVEPIGLHAGTLHDPNNLAVFSDFQDQLLLSLPGIRLDWLHHFRDFFNSGNYEASTLVDGGNDHNSSIFYAFDLSITEITGKAYFFSKNKAKASRQSNLDVTFEAIQTAPYVTGENLKAGAIFLDFCSSSVGNGLEHEMMAIDLVDPLESRLKLYFRCRETTFNSVIDIMTLGGRIKNTSLGQGLQDLHRLWKALFGADDRPDQPLAKVDHRTAGILYNVEFKLEDRFPVTKIYMPVRHYSKNDEAVMQALKQYFQSLQLGRYMDDYVTAMGTLL